MAKFTLDETKFRPVPQKSLRLSNMANNFSTKRGVLYRWHKGHGWMRYDDPEHVYSINDQARVVRAAKAKKERAK